MKKIQHETINKIIELLENKYGHDFHGIRSEVYIDFNNILEESKAKPTYKMEEIVNGKKVIGEDNLSFDDEGLDESNSISWQLGFMQGKKYRDKDFQRIPKENFYDPEYDAGFKKGYKEGKRIMLEEANKWIRKNLEDPNEGWVIKARKKYFEDKKDFGEADDGELWTAKENMSGALGFNRALNLISSELGKIRNNKIYETITTSKKFN